MSAVPTTSGNTRNEGRYALLDRLGAASGLVATVILLVIVFAVAGEDSPDFGEPAQAYASYFKDNADSIQLAALLSALFAIELVWFAGYIRGEIDRAEHLHRGFSRLGTIAFGGGVLAAAGFVLFPALDAGISTLANDTDPEIVRALSRTLGAVWMLAGTGLVILLTAASIAILRSWLRPRWTGFVGLLSALGFLLTLFFVLDPTNDDSWVAIGWPIGFLTFAIWLVALSITLIRDVTRTPIAASTEPGTAH